MKKGAYSKIGFIEFIEYLCRIVYARFSMKLDRGFEAGLLTSNNAHEPNVGAVVMGGLSVVASMMGTGSVIAPHSQEASISQSARKSMAPDNDERAQEHQKLMHAYKEFLCETLDPWFDSHQLEFCDPDEDVDLASSDESVFEYHLPEGYDSHGENAHEFIAVISSDPENGGSSDDFDDMPDVEDLSNQIMNQLKIPGTGIGPRVRQQHEEITNKSKSKMKRKMMAGRSSKSIILV